MLRIAISTLFLITSPMLAMSTRPASNGRCPVLGNPVGERNRTASVRGRAYFVCCPECGDQLTGEPDKYLDKDGKPKNASGTGAPGQIRDHY